MKNITIIFDFGGVLIDWNPHYLYEKLIPGGEEATRRFLKEIGFKEWNTRLDGGLPFSKGVEELCQRFPQHEKLIRAYDERYDETIPRAFEPVVEIVRELKEAGYPLYGLSNYSKEKFYLTRQKYDFFDLFQGMVVSGEVGVTKPDEAIFQLILKLVERPAEECLFIDDVRDNIAAAERLGFETILYRSPKQLADELQARGILPVDGRLI